jgi:hypothetical protein
MMGHLSPDRHSIEAAPPESGEVQAQTAFPAYPPT